MFFREVVMGCFLLGMVIFSQFLQWSQQENQALESDEQREAITLKQKQIQLDLWQKSPGLGFDNLFADWVFLQFLQYMGDDEARADTGYELSADYFESIIPKDPFYTQFYLFLSSSSSLYAGQPVHTVSLMDEGLSQMTPSVPEDGYMVWRYKGTDELLFLGDAEKAQASFQMAADWANMSDDQEAELVAELSQKTADFLAENPVSKRARVDAWASVLSNSFDERTQKLAVEQIEALGGQVQITEDGQLAISYPKED